MRKFNRINDVLKEQGRSQKWLSTKINRTRTAVNAICQNIHQPSLKLLFEIANTLEVDPCKLIGDGTELEKKR